MLAQWIGRSEGRRHGDGVAVGTDPLTGPRCQHENVKHGLLRCADHVMDELDARWQELWFFVCGLVAHHLPQNCDGVIFKRAAYLTLSYSTAVVTSRRV